MSFVTGVMIGKGALTFNADTVKSQKTSEPWQHTSKGQTISIEIYSKRVY